MADSEEELKTILMRVKDEKKKKTGLKFNIKKKKKKPRWWYLVPSLHGKKNKKEGETVTDFLFLGSKITVDGDCSREIKRCLLLGGKAMA